MESEKIKLLILELIMNLSEARLNVVSIGEKDVDNEAVYMALCCIDRSELVLCKIYNEVKNEDDN